MVLCCYAVCCIAETRVRTTYAACLRVFLSESKAAIPKAHERLAIILCRPPAVLSKEDVEAEKATMRAIDARPIKKVAEAKQRKRKRLQVRTEHSQMGLLHSSRPCRPLCLGVLLRNVDFI